MNDVLAAAIRRGRALKHAPRNIPIRVFNKSVPIPVIQAQPEGPPVVPKIFVQAAGPLPKFPQVTTILRCVADHFGMTTTDVISQRRHQSVVRARQVVMYLANIWTPQSYPHIGRVLGDRDHTTVMHGIKKIKSLIAGGDKIAADVASIEQKLGLGNENNTQELA